MSRKSLTSNILQIDPNSLTVHCQCEAKMPSDLADVVERWFTLPEAVRAGIVAMVRASTPQQVDKDVAQA
jgi:acetolactate synthase small subunit